MLSRVLELSREQLGLQVAWVSEIDGETYHLRATTGDTDRFGVHDGLTVPLEQVYCAGVLRGELPNAIPDVRADERTATMPITEQFGVGAYIGVPIPAQSGGAYGTLCCLSQEADPTLGDKDVRFLRLLAGVAGEEFDRERRREARHEERRARILRAIDGDGLHVVFQPIVDLRTFEVVGVEALARFEGDPPGPQAWFSDAWRLGLGEELELSAMRLGLERLDELPPGAYLSLNASPRAAMSSALADLLDDDVAPRVLLEITEETGVEDYEALLDAVAALRRRGVRMAVDDAGAGYACLRHILRLSPDVIKLDITLVRGIDDDRAREALASSLVAFSARVDARLVAEGVETRAELDKLAALGVDAAQGFLLARPGDLPLTAITARAAD